MFTLLFGLNALEVLYKKMLHILKSRCDSTIPDESKQI